MKHQCADLQLSYENLKFVLLYLGANKRLQLVRRCPSLKIDNIVPLRINSLSFAPMKMIINNTTYQLGVYRKVDYHLTELKRIQEENASGGTPFVYNRFGFRETSEETKMTPGDINLQFETLPEKEIYTPPHDSYILLTIKTKNARKCKKEYVKYSKTLQEASKLLNTWIFEGRDFPVQVGKLNIESSQMIIRLPPDVKFQVRQLRIPNNVDRVFERLCPILTDSSFPLKVIEIIDPRPDDYDCKKVREAGKMIALKKDDWHIQPPQSWAMLPSRTHYANGENSLYVSTLIRHWKENKPTLGTWFSAGFENVWDIAEVLRQGDLDIKFRERNRTITTITIPVDDYCDIKVYYEEVDKNKYDSYGKSHILNMKIVGK